MGKLVLFDHISLDGFVAGPNHEMDWIYVDDQIFEVAAHMTNHSDTALYGRVTFQMMDNYWPTAGDEPDASLHDRQHSAWYNKVPKFVVSTTLQSDRDDVKVIGNDIISEVRALKDRSLSSVLMLGSPSTAKPLIGANLIDEYWLFVNPIILGKGISLFGDFGSKLKLKLRETRTFNAGVVMLRYDAASGLR